MIARTLRRPRAAENPSVGSGATAPAAAAAAATFTTAAAAAAAATTSASATSTAPRTTAERTANSNRVTSAYESVKTLTRGPVSTLWLVQKRKTGSQNDERGQSLLLAEYDLQTFSQRAKEVAFSEAKTLRALAHPNVLRCVDMFYEAKASKICLVHERPRGVSLAAYLAETRQKRYLRKGRRGEFSQVPSSHALSLENTLHIFTQVCLGVKAFHECGAVHGNLSLSNVFVGAEARRSPFGDAPLVKVGTPDLCGKFSSFETILATTGSPFDVPGLASPERQAGRPATFASDIWGLGCFLYGLVTSDCVFKGANLQAQLYAVCNRPPPSLPVDVRMSAYGKDLSALQLSLLCKDPEKRPAIADVLKTAFVQESIKYLVAKTKGRDGASLQQPNPKTAHPCDPRFSAPVESRRALEKAIRQEEERRKAAAEAESRLLLAQRAANTATHSMRERRALRERERALLQVAENRSAAAKTKEKVKAMEERNREIFQPPSREGDTRENEGSSFSSSSSSSSSRMVTVEEQRRKRERDRRLKMENRRREIERAHEIAREDRLLLQQRLIGRQERGALGGAMTSASGSESKMVGNGRVATSAAAPTTAEIKRYFRRSER